MVTPKRGIFGLDDLSGSFTVISFINFCFPAALGAPR
jgi:hypothetical protein